MKLMKWKLKGNPSVSYTVDKKASAGANERDLVFLVARVPLLINNETMPDMHHKIMQTIYKRIMGVEYDVPRGGGVWETIGFQTGNPHTDLRDTGMFSMMQLLNFLELEQSLARDIYYMSRDDQREFPFAITSVRMTLIALRTLRTGRLSKLINQASRPRAHGRVQRRARWRRRRRVAPAQ